MKPNLFIIGAQKSGSTFVQECLAEHPEVFLVPGEITFFESPDYKKENLIQFESLFSKVTTEKAIGVKRPTYISKPEVPENIYNHYPTAKLVLVIRNPVERAVSAYFHYIRDGFLPLESLELGLRKIINGEYRYSFKRSHEVIEFGFYYKHLTNYLSFFSKEQIHITLFDEIKKDSKKSLKSIYDFLEIRDDFIPKSLNQRPQAVIYSIERLKILTLRNKFMFNYNKDKTRLFLKKRTIFDKVVVRLINKVDGDFMNLFFKNDKPVLSDELKGKLIGIYQNDIDKLSIFLGKNLDDWKN